MLGTYFGCVSVDGVGPLRRNGGGAVSALALHPTDPSVIFAGATNGGVWMTRNALVDDVSWTSVTPLFPGNIGSIAIDVQDPQKVYACFGTASAFSRLAGERSNNFLKSVNGGTVWTYKTGPSAEFTSRAGDAFTKGCTGLYANGSNVVLTWEAPGDTPLGIGHSADGG